MVELQAQVWQAKYVEVVARAWSDAGFKAKLLSDPVSALTEAGVELPRDKTIKVVENTADTLHLVLPADPAEDQLTDADLEQATGRQASCNVTPCCCGSNIASNV